MKKTKITLAALAAFALTSGAFAVDGQDVFKKKFCGKCHAVDEAGRAKTEKKGTYLGDIGSKRSAAWLDEYMKDPAKARAKDAKLAAESKKYEKPMAKVNLKDDERKALVEYMSGLK